MAERVVSVRLQALTQAYKAAMSDAARATDGLTKTDRWQNMGAAMSNLGSTLTSRVTLPLVALGGFAVKASADFDKTFTTMQTLAGVSASEIEGLKEQVKGLAGETGKSPQELAEALYFLQSAGLDSAQSMDALEMSAKASAAGLGDTVAVADAVSSAMLAYAESGLTAAEATDVLVATAREGKAEPTELASQLGRVIPIAAELGVSFDQVGAAIAALSQKGNDAGMATTQLTNVLNKLLKPSKQAEESLEGVGLSTDKIRQMLEEKGLLGTLEELRARLGDNGFVRFLEDQQAVQGGLALLGGDLEATKGIFDELANSAGATDNAFSTWAESMGADNARAFANLQVALIDLGDVLAPLATDVLGFVSTFVEGFSRLPEPVQQVAIWLGILGAAMGPLMSVGGNLLIVGGGLVKVFGGLWVVAAKAVLPTQAISGAFAATTATATTASVAVTGFQRSLGVMALALTAAVVAWQFLNNETEEASGFQDSLESALRNTNGAFDEQIQSMIAAELTAKDLIDPLKDLGFSLSDVMDAIEARGMAGFTDLAQRIQEAGEAAGLTDDEISDLTERTRQIVVAARNAGFALEQEGEFAGEAGAAADGATGPTDDLATALGETGEQAAEAESAIESYLETLRGMFDPLFGLTNALRDNQDAQAGVREAERDLSKARQEHGENSRQATEAERELDQANQAVAESALGVIEATGTLNDAISQQPGLVNEAIGMLDGWVASGLITRKQARIIEQQFLDTAFAAGELGATDPNVAVSETGNRNVQREMFLSTFKARELDSTSPIVTTRERGNQGVRNQLGNTRAKAEQLDRQHPDVRVSTSGHETATSNLRAVAEAVGLIPTSRTVNVSIRPSIVGTAKEQQLLRMQHGGRFPAGEWMMVGEAGPELMFTEGAGRVFPHHDPLTQAALTGPGMAGHVSPATSGASVTRMEIGFHITGSGGLAQMVHKGVKTGDIRLSVNGQRVRVQT